ncbi:MAG: nucleoside hydrolase [Chloroflexi bacterium]|nr:nucleoside hydrolase [Chloroflexota bacterium]
MKRILIDTDIGTDVDDAMALSLAALSPELILEGVTTVHGDAPLRARIARRLLMLAGRADVPVVAGASFPMQAPLPPNFHWQPRLRGHEGRGILSEEELAPSADKEAVRDDAAAFIVEKARQYRGELAVIAIGSLTNVARALQLEPRLADWLHDLTIMGGMVDASRFDWHPMLETNLNCDPQATREVFASGIPLTLVPMEVTTQVFLTAEQRAEMRSWGSPLATTLVTLMEEMLEGMASLSEELGLPADFYQGRTFMHDPLAIYTSMATQHVTTRRMNIAIEEIDQTVRTIAYADRPPNAWVCDRVEPAAFVDFWMGRIRSQSARSVKSPDTAATQVAQN